MYEMGHNNEIILIIMRENNESHRITFRCQSKYCDNINLDKMEMKKKKKKSK